MMSTHQQPLLDAGSEARPPILERGSYVPWSSRFMSNDLRCPCNHLTLFYTNNHLRTSSNTRNQVGVQADRVDIQSRIVGNSSRYVKRTTGNQGELAENRNVQKETRNGNNDFLLTDTFEIIELEDLSANICMMARIQQVDNIFEDGPSYDSAFIKVNDRKVARDKNAHDQQDNAMELLARNAYKEAEKQQIIAKKINH
ncbi:hypothetical protein Tco_1357464 [Tanacetum coccineum]